MNQTAMALALSGFSFLLTVIWGGPLLRILRTLSIGEKIRVDGPKRHFAKLGTPTMGGVLILFPVALLTVLFNAIKVLGVAVFGNSVLVPLIVFVSYALIGSIDDWFSLRGIRGGDGLSVRQKLILQLIVAVGTVFVLRFLLDVPTLFLPGINFEIGLTTWIYFPVAVIIIVGFSNAVNFTDGLDGLAIGPTVVVGGCLVLFVYVAGHVRIAEYLQVAYVPGVGEVTVFCGAMVGAGLGFLWFNAYPAQVFMGDVGSLSLGGAIGFIAILCKQELVLLLVGGLFVIETLSVVVQVGYFKMTGGKRFFRMAPIHHHFELTGVPESKIIVRFWILSILLAMLALSTLKIR